MAQSPAARMQAMRERQKADYTRLDVMLKKDDARLVRDNAKRNSMTKAEYIAGLLHDGTTLEGATTAKLELMVDLHNTTLKEHQAEIKSLKAQSYSNSELEAEIVSLKSVRTDKNARAEVARLRTKVEVLEQAAGTELATIDRLIAETDTLRKDKADIIKLNKILKKELSDLKKSNTVTRK